MAFCARFCCLWLVLASVACGDEEVAMRGNKQPGEPCAITNECAIGFTCESAECTQMEPHRVTLSWTTDTDLDLHVRTPDGTHVYFDHALGAQAWLGVDGCSKHACSPDGSMGADVAHYEHAFLIESALRDDEDAGSEGDAGDDSDAGDDDDTPSTRRTYRYWVENYDCNRSSDYTLQVIARDETVVDEHTGTLAAACVSSPEHTFTAP